MKTAHITINEDLHDWAVKESTSLLGSEKKFSTYVSMLISKEKKNKEESK